MLTILVLVTTVSCVVNAYCAYRYLEASRASAKAAMDTYALLYRIQQSGTAIRA